MWGRVVDDGIWGAMPQLQRESLILPRPEFVCGVSAAVHERDHPALMGTFISKPELALYNCVNKGPGLKEYLLRHEEGHKAAHIHFKLGHLLAQTP